ncbi:MAG: DUF885 family protein [Gemmatimonadaceae bacterium]
MSDPLEQFMTHYFRRRPVNATFTGAHEHDACLPDWSPAGIATMDSEMREIVRQLDAQFPAPSCAAAFRNDPHALDAELMRGFCEIQLSEHGSGHGMRGNPALWTGEAVFSVIALMIRDVAPLDERVRLASARMEAIPRFLEQARDTMGDGPLPAPWVARALRDCEGAERLFASGVHRWLATGSVDSDVVTRALMNATATGDAFRAIAGWLRERPEATEDAMRCGATHYDLLLRRGHHTLRSRADLLAAARAALDDACGLLDEMAADVAGSWSEVQRRLAEDHPAPADYLGSFATEWAACRETILDADIVSWPDWPLRYEEIPAFTREAAPYLYYLFYRAPAPLDPYHQHVYVVSPLPEGDPVPHLRAWNKSVIRLNHVLHHGGVGHHVQNWHAYHRAPTRVGKIAAVDCANRIGMFCGGTMAEGWACYATGLMGELGGLTTLELVAERHSAVRQLVRAVVDLSFHAGELSFDEAVALFVDRAGMDPAVARAEMVKCSMFPRTAVMYWLGTQGILDLREAMIARDGDSFSLKRFHDELLGHGSIPVPLVARMMTEDAA